MSQAQIQQVDGRQADRGAAAGLVKMRLRAEGNRASHRGLGGISGWPTGSGNDGREDGEKEKWKPSTDTWGTSLVYGAAAGAVVFVDKGQFRLKCERKY